MLKLNNANFPMTLLVAVLFPLIGNFAAANLTETELQQLCQGKNIEIIAYPRDPYKFIICINNDANVGVCYAELDINNPPYSIPTCFDELKQTCSKDNCVPEPDASVYVKNVCSKDSNIFTRLPADDCEHFYICLGSKEKPLYDSCPDGLHFSPQQKICTTPLTAGCKSLDSMCTDKKGGYRFAGKYCYDYYECLLSKPIARTCPYGQHFDSSTKQCIPSAYSNCVENPIRMPDCKPADNGLYFQHQDCDKFYVCVNTSPLKGQCGQGYYFDPISMHCIKDTKGVCLSK